MQEINEDILKKFALKFHDRFVETKDYLEENAKSDLYKSIPDILTIDNVNVHAAYSDDTKHVMLRFNKGNKFNFRATKVDGDVSNIFDPLGAWKGKQQVGFNIKNSNVTLSGGSVKEMRPFKVSGEEIEVFITNFTVDAPPFSEIDIEYGLIVSYKRFLEIYQDINSYVANLTSVYFEYEIQDEKKGEYVLDLKAVRDRMVTLFFDESIGELKIDKFIEENPIILRVGLSLVPETFLHAKPMKDIHDDNPKEFIPDLVAFCNEDYNWKIVDYKKANKSIIRNSGKERTTLRSTVHLLISQLEDYVEYFSDKSQADHYKETYGVDIKYPSAIGIIGRVSEEEIDDFNKLKQRLPSHTKIVPYNFLFDSFERFIKMSEDLIK
ncbi:hypothetical protein BBI11_09795 [Planococcus maritimus]|uniref:Shedu anti-phage system protein SduA domain-containing protein n=1 Tax=Planococcus maritimus TaxID=192421 RepID=UPI00080F2FA2|nr:Shedu anti-phage system protein SduA domain-containing protein [Planococcus maritimus]ANU17295.1 hypothetical protein BBI11_09795 [Planococcus maritimus]